MLSRRRGLPRVALLPAYVEICWRWRRRYRGGCEPRTRRDRKVSDERDDRRDGGSGACRGGHRDRRRRSALPALRLAQRPGSSSRRRTSCPNASPPRPGVRDARRQGRRRRRAGCGSRHPQGARRGDRPGRPRLHAGRARDPPSGSEPSRAEVLRLVATGQNNREIAESLILSRRTMTRHVQRRLRQELGVLVAYERPARTRPARPGLTLSSVKNRAARARCRSAKEAGTRARDR